MIGILTLIVVGFCFPKAGGEVLATLIMVAVPAAALYFLYRLL
jgi:hypothetical protein